MIKVRKKPVEVDACEWTGDNAREVYEFLGGDESQYMTGSGDNFRIDHFRTKGGLIIKTLEGEHVASLGDFIIKGIKGEFYPCKPDIFWRTYELV